MSAARLAFAAGGSGGHIYPALAVAGVLAVRGHHILFIGQENGMEARLVPEAGFDFIGVRAGKWERSRPDPRQLLPALAGPWSAARALRHFHPALVVGAGGFASFPALAAARILGLPTVLLEQNAYPGLVTRLFARGARLVALAGAATTGRLPRGVPTEVLGLPIREARLGRTEARRTLGLPETGLLTLVMGGSQGSAALNAAVPLAFSSLPSRTRDSLTVLHLSGSGHEADVHEDRPNYRVLPYADATLAWSAADLAITRAGMGTLAEAAFHGVPLIMVPLPTAAEDHQRHNALAVENAGAGRMLLQTELERLAALWNRCLEDGPRRAMSEAARKLSPEGAALRVACRIESLLGEVPSPKAPATAAQETK